MQGDWRELERRGPRVQAWLDPSGRDPVFSAEEGPSQRRDRSPILPQLAQWTKASGVASLGIRPLAQHAVPVVMRPFDEEWHRPPRDGSGVFAPLPLCLNRLAPPPYHSVNTPALPPPPPGPTNPQSIHQCMGALAEWPATGCAAPCVDPRACWVPSPVQRSQVEHLFVVRPLTPAEASTDPVAYAVITVPGLDEADFIRAAIALLRAEIDLVQWAICTTGSWSPLLTDAQVHAVVDQITDWILASPGEGTFATYMVMSASGTLCGGLGSQGAYAWATDIMDEPANCTRSTILRRPWARCESAIPADGAGVVVAIQHCAFVGQLGAYLGVRDAPAPSPAVLQAGMNAVLWCATVLCHELLHLAGEEDVLPLEPIPGVSADPSSIEHYDGCWPLQIQAMRNLVFAMTRRYPCLASAPEVAPSFGVRGDPDWFMATW